MYDYATKSADDEELSDLSNRYSASNIKDAFNHLPLPSPEATQIFDNINQMQATNTKQRRTRQRHIPKPKTTAMSQSDWDSKRNFRQELERGYALMLNMVTEMEKDLASLKGRNDLNDEEQEKIRSMKESMSDVRQRMAEMRGDLDKLGR